MKGECSKSAASEQERLTSAVGQHGEVVEPRPGRQYGFDYRKRPILLRPTILE